MISSLIFLVIAVGLFFWILAPFFKEFDTIPETDDAGGLGEFTRTNIGEFEADYEMGKISAEELKEIESSLEKE